MDESEIDEDLTNFSWLTTFNLSKNIGMPNKYSITLSPPITPSSSPISPMSSHAHECLLNSSSRDEYYDDENDEDDDDGVENCIDEMNECDESDSNFHSSASIGKTAKKWPIISKLIKPWQLENGSDSALAVATGQNKLNQLALRPPYSFSCLAYLAIESSHRKALSVKEIYNWIIQSFPYYRSVPSGSWKNSIRHNLANKKIFCKVDKNLLAVNKT